MAKSGGLRFEVYPTNVLVQSKPAGGVQVRIEWEWTLVGAEGPVAKSATTWNTEDECRSALAKNKGRLKASQWAKVVTLTEEPTYADD